MTPEEEIVSLKERIKQLEKEKADAIKDQEIKDFYANQKSTIPYPHF